GYTVGAFALGGLVGSLATMYFNVWFGRRMNIIISCCWFIFGGILSACAVNIGMYSVGRALVGFGSGMAGSSVAIYVSEISTKSSRGALGSVFEFFLNLGILLTQVAGRYMKDAGVWRMLWGIPTIIAAIQLLLMVFFNVECPRRLCADGKTEQAREAMQRLRKGADITYEFQNLLDARQREVESNMKKMSILDIILVKDRHITWNTIIVMMLQAYNQVGGIGPLSVYAVGFLASVFNNDYELASNISLANATGKIVATLICVITLQKVGRRPYMLISTMGMTISCIFIVIGSVLGDHLGPLVITGALLFTFTYAMGCGTIPWLIAPEMLPLHALPPGSALGCASNWLFNFLINTLWPQQHENLGNYSFTVFAAINFVGFVFFYLFQPETGHRDLDQKHGGEKEDDVETPGTAGSSNSLSDTDPKSEKVQHIEEAK
ncbi:general substrate transporter, partial [Zychaea mexicana]|uniref:general substrate transporter n=1 Tax=Zychaea mexicana TaxID=64656 RepID=UPI0022FE7DBC